MPQDCQEEAADPVEPPKIYIASCGVLCDIFWWARRNSPGESPSPMTPVAPTDEPETP